jgi:hypothetical protein
MIEILFFKYTINNSEETLRINLNYAIQFNRVVV